MSTLSAHQAALFGGTGLPFRDVLLATSPLSYHPMGDASGSTAVALAGSNAAYQGSPTLGRPPLLPGDVATSMGTSAASNRMSMAQTLPGTGPFTICLAARFTYGAAQMLVFDQNLTGSSNPRVFLAFNRSGSALSDVVAGAIDFFNYDGSVNRGCRVLGAGLNDGQAHLILFGRSGTNTPFMYIDGAPQSFTGPGLSSGDIMDGGNWGVGQSPATAILPYNGDVGHFATWNRALTPTEQADLFSASGL